MDKTTKLYYSDSHVREFSADVLSCTEKGGEYHVVLDKTAFFPGGGGQECDGGSINGNAVKRVFEDSDIIYHVLSSHINVGTTVECCIDWDARFQRMQRHSGEHIVSGLLHKHHGLDNVGFHMGKEDVTIDINGVLTRDQIDKIEFLANQVVWSNITVLSLFPSSEELKNLTYRSKLDLTENVRIVKIEDVDICACCAPHVKNTGEIGIIKILEAVNYKGGMRLHLLMGAEALVDYSFRHKTDAYIASSLSTKQSSLASAFDKLQADMTALKQSVSHLASDLVSLKAKDISDADNICVFEELEQENLRDLVKLLVPKTKYLAAGFSGNDTAGYRYIISSSNVDLKSNMKTINAAISGRGGGSSSMIEGYSKGTKEAIYKYITEFNIQE